jgi:hypothetical protein
VTFCDLAAGAQARQRIEDRLRLACVALPQLPT